MKVRGRGADGSLWIPQACLTGPVTEGPWGPPVDSNGIVGGSDWPAFQKKARLSMSPSITCRLPYPFN